MNARIPIRRLIICSAIAVIAIGFGVYNVCYSTDYVTINAVLQSVVAIAGITAISEIAAMLSKFVVMTYTLTAVVCAIMAHIVTPWNIVLPRADMNGGVMDAYQSAVISSLVSYSVAFAVSILVGVFFLHRKDIFKSSHS